MKEKFDTPYTDSDHTGNGGIRKAASKKYCERRGDQSIYEHGGYWDTALFAVVIFVGVGLVLRSYLVRRDAPGSRVH